MPWRFWRRHRETHHPREPEWDDTERRQQEGIAKERRERRALEARIDAILREYEALANPRILRKTDGR